MASSFHQNTCGPCTLCLAPPLFNLNDPRCSSRYTVVSTVYLADCKIRQTSAQICQPKTCSFAWRKLGSPWSFCVIRDLKNKTHSSPKSWWLYSGWNVVPSSSTSSGKRTKRKSQLVSGKWKPSKLCMTCHLIVSSTAVANKNIVINNWQRVAKARQMSV